MVLCKTLAEAEVAAIVNIKQAFEKPMEEMRTALYTCDSGCPHGHYTKAVVMEHAGSIIVSLLTCKVTLCLVSMMGML